MGTPSLWCMSVSMLFSMLICVLIYVVMEVEINLQGLKFLFNFSVDFNRYVAEYTSQFYVSGEFARP